MKLRNLILATLVFAISAPAMADIKLSVGGGVNYGGLTKTGDPALLELKGGLSYIGGATLGVGLGQRVDLEVGGMYMQRKIDVTVLNSAGDAVKSKWVQIPAGFRFWISPYFSAMVGGYYDVGMTDGYDNSYGATGALRLSVPMAPTIKFFAEPRFNYQIKSPDAGDRWKEVIGMAGFQFSFGK